MAAVLQNGLALAYAAEEFQADRDIVFTAVSDSSLALQFAADSLLEDETFARDARNAFHFFKVQQKPLCNNRPLV
eukprot:5538260-Amphidinium_carterae.1